jgi:glutathione S-transferase
MSTPHPTLLLPVPQGYGRVLLAASGGLILNTIHSFSIGTYFRPRAGIILPQLYATPEQAAADPNAYTYNCAQRAHANYVENLFPTIGAMLLGGLRYPGAATCLGVAWMGWRLVYFYNYTRPANYSKSQRGEIVHGRPPMGRGTAVIFWLCQFVLYGLAVRSSWEMYAMGL